MQKLWSDLLLPICRGIISRHGNRTNRTSPPIAKRDLLARIIESVTVYESSVDIKFKAKGDKRLMEEFNHEHNGN